MSFAPGTFYVYIIQHPTNIGYGYTPSFYALVAFPSRTSADEFWHAVQISPDNKPQDPEACRRYYSQYMRVPVPWTQMRLTGWNAACVVQLADASGRPGLVAPPQSQPDNVNGRGFYIRSAMRPNLFWHLYQKRLGLTLSSTHQTRFIVRRTTPLPFSCRPEEDILIGKDDINIFLFPTEDQEGEMGEMIVRGPRNELVPVSWVNLPRPDAGVFKFSLFDRGFGVRAMEGPMSYGPVYVTQRPDAGERWEFIE
ncbi:hypothetical protein P691DRAFT_777063 [Macrolepiota fuliginosa MF-IS2]|uniref:Uncharacterized protein n=1 Tax=Macrolepiota fuliginosa MF-IS2 TaxID=1400762 RepID=A0A9P6C244_9AGAR|nr:hypothetical protein P691DRAFT_777063 [Macrolepiota fuliginosa MF-IS2]